MSAKNSLPHLFTGEWKVLASAEKDHPGDPPFTVTIRRRSGRQYKLQEFPQGNDKKENGGHSSSVSDMIVSSPFSPA